MIYKNTHLLPLDRSGIFLVKVFHRFIKNNLKAASFAFFLKISVRQTKHVFLKKKKIFQLVLMN